MLWHDAFPGLAYLIGAVPVLIWVYLLFGRAGFWRVGRQLAPLLPAPAQARRVVAIVPARDEAPYIAEAVSSLLQQRFDGSLHVVLVDDGSTDGTASIAAAAALALRADDRLTIVRGAPLPRGWTGKLWAMSQGVAAAAALDPHYLLFTDADIRHEPDNVTRLVAQAEAAGSDLVSYMVKLAANTFAEKCLVPAFVFFFLKLYPPKWIASSRRGTAGAAGGCILIRPAALSRAGGLASIRSQIIDDCALARAVKASGGSVWLGLTRSAHSLRSYHSFAQIGRMISRTAFSQLRHSYALLLGTILGLFLTYLLPPLLLLAQDPILIGLGFTAWMLMSLAYLPMVRFYRVSLVYSVCLPAIALFYALATIHSAVQYATGQGGQWKGRAQDSRLPHEGG